MNDIALKIGISRVAVSKAMNGKSGVSEATRAKVIQIANEMGYVADPLLTALTHYRRTSSVKPIQAGLAWINPWKQPEQLKQYNEFNLYWKGAEAKAKKLGFRLHEFNTADVSLKRILHILTTRSIQGIILPPLRDAEHDWRSVPWEQFSTVRFGHSAGYPEMHLVTSAQTANTMLAFGEIQKRGYQRIGFVCKYEQLRLFGAGFYWAQRSCHPDQQLPLLSFNGTDGQQEKLGRFSHWINTYKPDAILTDLAETPSMLHQLGFHVPEDIGLATTSIHDTSIDAGIDQKPYEIGQTAVQILASLLTEGCFGLPETRHETLINGQWINGSMLPQRPIS